MQINVVKWLIFMININTMIDFLFKNDFYMTKQKDKDLV